MIDCCRTEAWRGRRDAWVIRQREQKYARTVFQNDILRFIIALHVQNSCDDRLALAADGFRAIEQ